MYHLNFHSKSLGLLITGTLLFAGCGQDDEKTKDANGSPVAEAGGNQMLSSDAAVNLSGSGSYDPDGDPLSFHWAFDSTPDGSTAEDMDNPFTVNDERDPTTSFTPDAAGTYVVSLIVIDGQGLSSAPDRTTITIQSGDAPVAEAGDEQSVNVGETVSMDGSGSWDGLGRDLVYDWSFARVPSHSSLSSLTDADNSTSTFTPDVSGLYLVALVVNNGLESSIPDTTVVRVLPGASDAPTADAGEDIAGEDCTHITLDGSDSFDPNGEPLTYMWDLEERPAGSDASTASFASRADEITSFYPDVDGDYIISLAVHDGVSWSVPDELDVVVTERAYNNPTAVNPGLNQVHDGGEAICEEAAYSYICGYCDAKTVTLGADAIIHDPDGDTVDFEWSVVSGAAAIHNPNNLETTVVLSASRPDMPDLCEPNDYTFRLTAVDCTGQMSSQMVTYTVNCCGYELGE
jgi:hypothetical protein